MINRIADGEWQTWREIRLEAVQLHPEAFGGSFEEESLWTEEEWRRGLRQAVALGYCEGGTICGIAVFAQNTALKMRHRGGLYGMYVRLASRGRGVGDALVKVALNEAREKVLQVHCHVVTSNEQARRLYERNGFEIYGTEPRALQVGGRFYDEHLMICRLDDGPFVSGRTTDDDRQA